MDEFLGSVYTDETMIFHTFFDHQKQSNSKKMTKTFSWKYLKTSQILSHQNISKCFRTILCNLSKIVL